MYATSEPQTIPDTFTNGLSLTWRRSIFWIVLTSALAIMFIFELTIGSIHIPVAQILNSLIGVKTERESWPVIIWTLRMPRALTAMTAGAALAAGGLILQTLFRNPLAGPWVLGIPAGARLGVALVLVLEGKAAVSFLNTVVRIGDLSLTAGACLGATGILLLIALISQRVNAVTLLIVGLMFQYLSPSLSGMLLHLVTDDQYRAYQSWAGSEFGSTTWSGLQILLPSVAVCLLAALLLSKALNSLLLGEEYARSAGTSVPFTRGVALAAMIGLSGIVTAYCGTISFLDLAVPHLCRGILRTSNHRVLMPAVILTGALIGLTADFLVHLPLKRHILHIDYVTALIGAPVILWLVLRDKSMRIAA
jgi:iron complex transport system permease protein